MICLEWIGPFEWWLRLTSAEQASWIQAFGTIAALAVAIGLGRMQARGARTLFEAERDRVEAERRRQATITAAALALAFEAAKLEAEQRLGILRPLVAAIPDDDRELGPVQSENLLGHLQLESAAFLAAAEQQALLFDENVGKLIVIGARAPRNFNRLLKSALLPHRGSWRASDMRELQVRLIKSLDLVSKVSGHAIAALIPLHGIKHGDLAQTEDAHQCGVPPTGRSKDAGNST